MSSLFEFSQWPWQGGLAENDPTDGIVKPMFFSNNADGWHPTHAQWDACRVHFPFLWCTQWNSIGTINQINHTSFFVYSRSLGRRSQTKHTHTCTTKTLSFLRGNTELREKHLAFIAWLSTVTCIPAHNLTLGSITYLAWPSISGKNKQTQIPPASLL